MIIFNKYFLNTEKNKNKAIIKIKYQINKLNLTSILLI